MNLQNSLQFVDVTPDAGHVLVHYLFTNTYQCLKPKHSSVQERLAAEFVTSIRVYTAAQTYILPSLVELAKGEVERLGKKLQAPIVFDSVRYACPSLSTNDIWLSSYLKTRLRLFLESSPEQLVGEIASEPKIMSISDILFKSMFELFHENTVLLREGYEQALGQASTGTAHLELAHESSKEPIDAKSINEDKKIRKETAFKDANLFDWRWKEDKIGIDEAQPLSEAVLEVKAAQDIGTSEEKDNTANSWNVEASKEKEKKKGKNKKNKKNNNKNLAGVDPPPGSSEDYLLVKSERGAKDDNGMELGDPWGYRYLEKDKERNKKSEINTPVSVSPGGDLTAEHTCKQSAKTGRGEKSRLEEEGWSFWGLGKNPKRERKGEVADLEPPPLLPTTVFVCR
ncbi:hypothetical protein ACHAQJ_000878 [Trichoderma viride]